MKSSALVLLVLALVLVLAAPLCAQNVNAMLNGTVRDSTGAVLVGATITVSNDTTGINRSAHSNADGYFSFTDLPVGSYSISVEMKGFKKYRQDKIALTAGQIRSVGDLTLTIGEVAETITVESTAAVLETASGEKSGVISGTELENTALRGRDYLDMLRLLPGVVDENDGGRDAPGPDGIRNIYINGGRENQKNISIDGVTSMDSGSNSTTHTAPTLNTIAEVKILASNFQAEFGRSTGGTIIVTTRGGGNQYHGQGFWSHRHEEFNANNYFNNSRSIGKTPYRFNLAGWNLSGPVWPKNRREAKLFFFASQEYTRQRVNYTTQQVRMPTALERKGDFSQTLDLNQNRLNVYDPLTATIFPGNLVPANRINPTGQAILNIMPLPNYTDPVPSRAVQWNYVVASSGAYPRRQDMMRLDWAPTDKWQTNIRYTQDIDEQHPPYTGCGACWINGAYNFDLTSLTFRQPGKGLVFAATRPITSTLFSETRFGYSMNRLTSFPDNPDRITKSKLGIDLPQWRPALNPNGFIPNITFGTPGTAPNISLNNSLPYKNVNNIFSLTENLSKYAGRHTFRMGVYIERTRKDQLQGTATRGTISFSDDSNNPTRTRYGFASALMGIMTSYTESTNAPYGFYRFTNLEWYAQDNWRVTRRLALDYGVRFYHDLPQDEVRGQTSAFVQGFYNRANAPVLITSGRNAAGTRIGVDPLTGAQYNVAFIGTFAPGHGDTAIGMVSAGTKGFPYSLYTTPALMLAPRVGFAYDPIGRGTTILRGGFGIFFDRIQGNPTMNMITNPPTSFSPTLYYSTFDDMKASANSALLAPSNIGNSLYGKGTMPASYQYSFSIGQSIGRFTKAEVSYVGNFARHLLWQRNINPVPIGAQFLNLHPENRDATTNAVFANNFLRPYVGYGDIYEYEFGGTSSYNSLQATMNTRLKGGLEMRGSYTFGKVLGTANSDTAQMNPFFAPRQWNYGRISYSRDQVLTLMPNWRMPKGWLPSHKALRIPLENWMLYFTAQFSTGQPFRPGFSTVDGENMTGTPSAGAQMLWVGPTGCPDPKNCNLAQQFARPGMPRPSGTIEQTYWGNLGVNTFNRPGINNWDVRVTRRFNLFSEKRTLDLRVEAFNFPNHTQFSNIDTTARFDASGNQINALFLTPSAAVRPRALNMGVQVNF